MIADIFNKNPLAWILFAVLLVSLYVNYQQNRDLTHVCQLAGAAVDEARRRYPPTTLTDKVEQICDSQFSDGVDYWTRNN